jgi:hypothetical protein
MTADEIRALLARRHEAFAHHDAVGLAVYDRGGLRLQLAGEAVAVEEPEASRSRPCAGLLTTRRKGMM